jgi:hypothetical protein
MMTSLAWPVRSHTNGKMDDDRIPAPSENSRNWARTGVSPLLASRAVPDKLLESFAPGATYLDLTQGLHPRAIVF